MIRPSPNRNIALKGVTWNVNCKRSRNDHDYHQNRWVLPWAMCHLSNKFCENRFSGFLRNPANKQKSK